MAENLRLVPVDFESDNDWWPDLLKADFDAEQRALVSSSGVSMYITKAATAATLGRLSVLAARSVVVMTFMLTLDLVEEADRVGLEAAARGAEASGTPWISFYSREEILNLARDAGFGEVRYVATVELAERYLAGRTDGLTAAGGEGLLLART